MKLYLEYLLTASILTYIKILYSFKKILRYKLRNLKGEHLWFQIQFVVKNPELSWFWPILRRYTVSWSKLYLID